MYTIVGYSYKGGSGRSLALANLAVCLARLGKTVLLMDLDLGAPGQHFKLESVAPDAVAKGGMLDFFQAFIEYTHRTSLAPDDEKDTGFDFESIADRITTISLPQAKDFPRSPPGKIHFIPAGDIFNPDYTSMLSTGEWEQLLNFHGPISHELREGRVNQVVDKAATDTNVRFFERLHEVLATLPTLKPKPEYLLVDLRPGISEMSGVCMRTWADMVVCFFGHNKENLSCIGKILTRIRALNKEPHRAKPIVAVPVLTRVAALMDDQIGPSDTTLRKELDLQLSEPMPIIHADRHTEVREELTFGFDRRPANTRLAQDYVELFAYLLALEAGKAKPDVIADYAGRIRDGFGLPDEPQVFERAFWLYKRRGEIVNPHDGTRNVALKVQTFTNIVRDILSYVPSGKRDEALKTAGRERGREFGESLLNLWDKAHDQAPLSTADRVRHWCLFDSDVGFGRFEAVFEKEYAVRPIGTVRLFNSFLVNATEYAGLDSSRSLCALMEGYIEGVLQSIIDKKARVRHGQCAANVGTRCEFRFDFADDL